MLLWGSNRRSLLLLLALAGTILGVLGCGKARPAEENRYPAVTDPGRQQQLEELNKMADELYRNAATGALAEARGLLVRFGEQVASISFSGVASVEGVDALTDAVVEAKKQYNAVQMNPDLCVKAAARLKLAADALTHPNQPMWLQYYKVLAEDTKLFEYTVTTGRQQEAISRLGQLKDHYDTIRPSVWISRRPEEAEQMDSLLVFFTKYTDAGSFRQEVLHSGIGQWREVLDGLFRKSGDRTAYMPGIEPDRPVLWTFTVGSLIVAVLIFAAWRMFQSERSLIRRPGPRGMDGK